ncbi:MAG: type II toxin-antitoxin system RelE/ParE family toxin [Proteobacteria bacterium]|nr:type II toxin-antitoxin system RelE/ParE family toxin [Pseudomonadota bacterium]
MEITFKTNKLRKQFNEKRQLEKLHGTLRAKKIRIRMGSLKAAASLQDFWPPKSGPERCHELKGNFKGQISVDLDHPYRLIFIPDHDPVPRLADGGLDWSQVVAIKILGVEDTHE